MRNTTVTSIDNEYPQVCVKPEPLRISDAHSTAGAANRYANELRQEFDQLLYAAIARTDVKIAGRFTSLINELCFMTARTLENTNKETKQ